MNLPITLRGQRALILHPEGQSRRNLVTALESLDMEVAIAWPEIEDFSQAAEILFFDVDRGHDEQFLWKKGSSPIPMVALIGSEAPGRIEWALSHRAAAYLLKPISSAGVFSALTIAFHQFAMRLENTARIDTLTTRLKARPLVLKAVLDEMSNSDVDDDEAFKRIRTRSMNLQMSVEEYCVQKVSQSAPLSTQPRRCKKC